jgi:hypothetical protein
MGRDIVVDRPGTPVHLNSYILLVAESGVARKTTAINHVRTLYDQYLLRYPEAVSVFSARANMESIARSLASQTEESGTANVAFIVPELANFLGTKSYLADLPALLTELYDCADTATGLATSKTGVLELRRVWAAFLAACAPSWLIQAINPSVMEGGFASRLLIVREQKSKRTIPWNHDPVLVDQFRANLVERLHLAKRRAQFIDNKIQLTNGAISRYSSWYKNKSNLGGYYLGAFESREPDHVLRLAAYLSINQDSWVINENNITTAIRLVHNRKIDGYRTFVTVGDGDANLTKAKRTYKRSVPSNDQLLGVISGLQQFFIKNGKAWATQSSLVTRYKPYMKSMGIVNILNALHEQKMVQHVVMGHKGAGRPGRYWRGTSLITAMVPSEFVSKIDISRAA